MPKNEDFEDDDVLTEEDLNEEDDELDPDDPDDELDDDEEIADADPEKKTEAAKSDADEEAEGEEDPENKDDVSDAQREHRRLKKKLQKERKRAKEKEVKIQLEMTRAENQELARRLQLVENRAIKTEYDEVEGEIQRGYNALEIANRAIAKAEEEGDGVAVAKALDAKRRAEMHVAKHTRTKQYMMDEAKRLSERTGGLSSRAESLGRQWLSMNQTWMSKGGNHVVVAVQAIDSALAAEGYNPETKEYWKELSRRTKATFPHLAAPQTKKPLRKSTTGTSSVERTTTKLSDRDIPDTFRARLDEADLTPEQRKNAIKRYQAMKREQAGK